MIRSVAGSWSRCRKSLWRVTIVVACLIGLSACAGTPVTDRLMATPPAGLPSFVELSETPFFPQTAYYCGPAALATVLSASGQDLAPDEIAKQVYTPGRNGTLQTEIKTGSRRNARLALPVGSIPDALHHVANGRPVLILQNLALEIMPQWHYAVLVGYDLKKKRVVLRSGTTKRRVISLETLEHTWGRGDFWGVVVVAPEGPVPAGTGLSDWLQESLGLERAGNTSSAKMAYKTASVHWRNEPTPLISLSNIYYANGNLSAAASQLTLALTRAPDHPIALNNLAHILMKQGDLVRAEVLARRAQEVGGGAAARETLSEILAKQKG